MAASDRTPSLWSGDVPSLLVESYYLNVDMEAINGWIKAELFMDFHVTGDDNVEKEVDDYIVFFNEQRPAYSLGYLTPKQYKEQFAPAPHC